MGRSRPFDRAAACRAALLAVLAAAMHRSQLSTTASFRRDGRLFESNGCEPDLACVPAAGDLVAGGGDAVLACALASLRDARRSR